MAEEMRTPEIIEIIERVLSQSKADATEVLLFAGASQLTRFANSVIHQNVAERNQQVRIRAILGTRQGVAITNDFHPQALADATDAALDAARFSPARQEEISLAGPAKIRPVSAYSEATSHCPAARRAEAVGTVCRLADAEGLIASGALSTGSYRIAIGNSRGLHAEHHGTEASFMTVIMGDDSSGYAESAAWDLDLLDTESLGREAVATALRSRDPRSIEAGAYPVVLRPYAVCDLLETLSYMGFGALALQEQRSFMTGKLGQQVASPLVTIWDDGHDMRGMPLPFDYEGVPKQHVALIQDGVARGVVYDLETAAREGKESTGHGLPAPNTYGPMPLNLFMQAGDATMEELIEGIERGILVTRFHYTVPVHERQTVTTGMTRDGTFWIEKGEIAYPIKNLRFTQSYIGALARVEALGQDTRLISPESISVHAPAVRIGEFHFTGATEF